MPRDRLAASGDLGIQDRNHIEKSFYQSFYQSTTNRPGSRHREAGSYGFDQ